MLKHFGLLSFYLVFIVAFGWFSSLNTHILLFFLSIPPTHPLRLHVPGGDEGDQQAGGPEAHEGDDTAFCKENDGREATSFFYDFAKFISRVISSHVFLTPVSKSQWTPFTLSKIRPFSSPRALDY